MSKSKKTHKPQKKDKADVAQPPPAVDSAPTAMVKPIPLGPEGLIPRHVSVPRERGDSPLCPREGCGSGMIVNRTEKIGTNHPIRDGFGGRIVRYYQCKNPDCPIGRTEPYKVATPSGKKGRM